MKKLFLLSIVVASMLSSCGGIKATVADDPYAKESQAIVEKWMAAYRNLDAEALLSLYSSDLTWRDCGFNINCDFEGLADLQGVVPVAFREKDFKVQALDGWRDGFGSALCCRGIRRLSGGGVDNLFQEYRQREDSDS